MEKFKNIGHHDEFELSNINVDFLKRKIESKEVFYNHTLDKSDKSKWNDSYKLKNIDKKFLPEYLNKNEEKYKEWFD